MTHQKRRVFSPLIGHLSFYILFMSCLFNASVGFYSIWKNRAYGIAFQFSFNIKRGLILEVK